MIYIEIPGDCDYMPLLTFLGDRRIATLEAALTERNECIKTLIQECAILGTRADVYQKLAGSYKAQLEELEPQEEIF
jgi:hypothetical protein